MKKNILLVLVFCLLVSCGYNNNNNNNNNNIIDISKKDENKNETLNISYQEELQNFINKFKNNLDLLKETNCSEYKNVSIKKYCNLEKNKLNIKSGGEKFGNIIKSDISKILFFDCLIIKNKKGIINCKVKKEKYYQSILKDFEKHENEIMEFLLNNISKFKDIDCSKFSIQKNNKLCIGMKNNLNLDKVYEMEGNPNIHYFYNIINDNEQLKLFNCSKLNNLEFINICKETKKRLGI